MYTQIPCAVRNSETPLTAADIAAADARLAASDAVFTNGNAVLGDLIAFLGGNPSTISGPGSTDPGSNPLSAVPGGAGIPTGAYLAPAPGGGVQWHPPAYPARRLFPSYGDTYTKRGLPARRCVVPDILPLVTVLPVPRIVSPPVAGPAPIAAPPPAADCGPVTGDNICALIRDGCVLSSQVSPAQLAACSAAGWAGNRNMYPAIAARGGAQNGKYFGDVNLNPPAASGMSGLGDAAVTPPWYCVAIPGTTSNSCDMWTVPYFGTQVPIWAAAAGGVLLAALMMGSGGRRRR